MAHKYEVVATGLGVGKGGFWVENPTTKVRRQVIDNLGRWVGPDITSTSVSSSPSTSVSASVSPSPSTSPSSSRSTSVSSSVSSSPSAS
jgi:hypothetical protein